MSLRPKSVFQIHGVDASGNVVLKRKLRRAEMTNFFSKLPHCLVAMEACGGAHFWAREIAVFGHEVRLIPPSYVKPFVKRGKTDAGDAEAICEAVSRPSMRFVPVKSEAHQAQAMVLKARELLQRQRVQVGNALRAHFAELGIIAGLGPAQITQLVLITEDETDTRLPAAAKLALAILAQQFRAINKQIAILEKDLVAQVRSDQDLKNLSTIPGVGPITAAAIRAYVPDIKAFKSGRHFAAWIGLTPKSHSSGGKERLGRISKMGNCGLRTLLVLGAASASYHVKRGAPLFGWLDGLLQRRPFRVASVALANKNARITWAILTRGGTYMKPVSAGATHMS